MPEFDASAIPPLSLIRLPFQFTGSGTVSLKWFVVLTHVNGKAMCLKITSKGAKYRNSILHSSGWVWFKPSEIPCLPLETALQTENFHEIEHVTITRHATNGRLQIEPMIAGCAPRIIEAVKKSQRLSGMEKARIIAWLT